MNNSYTEVLVKKEHRATDTLVKYGMYALTAVFIVAGLLFSPVIWVLAVAMLIGCYFVIPRTDLEYEYLFVNGEMDIDMIMSKMKRKKVCTISMSDVEIVALTTSHRLDFYHNNQKLTVKDYSSGNSTHKRYSMIVREKETLKEIIIESDEYLCDLMKKNSPSKVFLAE